jgi:UDP-N-acetylmuramate: L-alanyl-gamma-D-glutamyl-meso-diaminopimelate ligase
MVGAAVQGFDSAVKLSTDAPIIILEGDEYLASPLHLESKFMFYAPQIALISGIAWDHINVFPVYEGYVNQFAKLMDIVEETIVYFKHDNELPKLVEKYKGKATLKGYENPSYAVLEEKTYIQDSEHKYAMSVFGEHNLQNIEGARLVCESLGVKKEDFYIAIADFSGAANRLQKLGENDKTVIYKDFAHSPSKLKATVDATRLQFKNRTIIAVMELHTFSSLNKDFWQEYAGSMDASDTAIVYIDEETLALKKMPPIDKNEVIASFKKDGLQVLQNKTELANFLLSQNYENAVLLLMTSGTFGGLDITNTTNEILAK